MNINEISRYYVYKLFTLRVKIRVKIVKINTCLHAWTFEFFLKFKFKFEILIPQKKKIKIKIFIQKKKIIKKIFFQHFVHIYFEIKV